MSLAALRAPLPKIATRGELCAGVDDLFVHTMAVNEGALRFYDQHGFAVVAEESANHAHYRCGVSQGFMCSGL